ncbi:S8/S53 family peptidase [Aquimarina sp. 2201CG5-10]|uniref:S8/S53 family peptidase n=1 Tax=Aquimarina callyspongiae TaxID=3098150 RepID=UPI002AB32D1F|nr:S8/S53 family peptidase [Aquimarina sp. 2201CG5-10]MDY8136197.1 S8/S53 family peptidase [Aquimarina sp. 2201CG5-10]
MKKLFFLLCSVFLFLGSSSIQAQVSSETNFYYYKGEKFYLEVDYSTISVSLKKPEVNFLNSNQSLNVKTTEIIEDYTRSNVVIVDQLASQHSNIKTFYLETLYGNQLSQNSYYEEIKAYKSHPNVLYASPTFINKEGNKIGLSSNFYVKLKTEKDIDKLYKMAEVENVEILGHNKFMPLWFSISIKEDSKLNALHMANIFYESGVFEATEPAFICHDLANSNDPLFNNQWTLNNTGQNGGVKGIDINVEQAWNLSTGNNTTVAVIDQGIEMTHPDLQANILGAGFDAQTNSTPSMVRGNHGTACAGIIGAITDNQLGVAGIAPSSDLISISVSFSGTTYQMLADGMNWAWQNGADVISNSWGGGTPSSIFDDAVDSALALGRNGLGSIVVFSSGNDNVNGAQYPSNSNPLILCVGAIDRCGIRSGRIDIVPDSCDPWCSNCRQGSSFGLPLDVVGGGTTVPTTDLQGNAGYSNNDYTLDFGGTSAACPFVAGVAALVLSENPGLTVQEVNTIIEQSAQKIRTDQYVYTNTGGRPNGIWNNELGYGLVDAYQAVLAAQTSECEENIIITQNVSAGQNDTHEASNSIIAKNTIFNNATASYKAGFEVTLLPNFDAASGADFTALIGECSNTQNEVISARQKSKITYAFIENEKSASVNYNTDNDLIIYPNPAKDRIVIDYPFKNDNQYTVELYDYLGKKIISHKVEKQDNIIHLSDLSNGLYFVKFIDNTKLITKEILISR